MSKLRLEYSHKVQLSVVEGLAEGSAEFDLGHSAGTKGAHGRAWCFTVWIGEGVQLRARDFNVFSGHLLYLG